MLRFALELAAFAGLGLYGWYGFEGTLRWLAVIGLPLLAMAAWGTFAVPEDPSRSGNAPVRVPGWLRLGLELAVLLGGALAMHESGHQTLGWVLAAAVLVHYAISWDRIAWLLEHR